MSMMAICNASAILEYDRRTSEIHNKSLDVGYDNNRTEE